MLLDSTIILYILWLDMRFAFACCSIQPCSSIVSTPAAVRQGTETQCWNLFTAFLWRFRTVFHCLQARQKRKMMFGEQHLVRFGSMSKPVGSDPPVTLQDSDLDPPEVNSHACTRPIVACCDCSQLCMHVMPAVLHAILRKAAMLTAVCLQLQSWLVSSQCE